MAKPFVKIEGNELKLMTDVQFENAKVVSILGKARMGKSSFLNCLSSHMTKENKRIFATKGTFEHVTKGVDYYHIPEKNILLLDTQGLDHEDSSHDPVLLLFVYLISDVVIFNGTNQLQNDTLKLLEPICAFMHSVDLEDIVKPKLFFRIANAFPIVLDNPCKSLDTINVCYDDQYQSIRDSIKLLFQEDIGVVATDHLNKSSTAFIDAGTFKPLLEDTDNGFLGAIEQIVDSLLKPSDKKNKYLQKLPEVIKKINNNEKINISKLDVVALTAENDILQWLQHCDATNYAPIEVDGLQKTYIDLVESRKLKKKAILSAFTRKFNSVPEKIKNKHYSELNTKLSEPINKAVRESELKAEARVERQYHYLTNATLPTLSSNIQSFNTQSLISVDKDKPFHFMKLYMLRVYNDLQVACEDIYEPVKEKYVKICTDAYDCFNKVLSEQKKIEKVYLQKANEMCSKVLNEFVATETSKAKNNKKYSILLRTNNELVSECIQRTLETTNAEIQKITRYSEIQGIIKGHALSLTVTEVTSYRLIDTYDLTSEMWKTFVENINNLSKELIPVWTDIKKGLLEGKHINVKYPQMMHVILKNPEIQFISTNLVEECFLEDVQSGQFYTTMDTYEKMYKPIIQEVVDGMVSKGYFDSKENIEYNIHTDCAENAASWTIHSGNKYYMNIEEIIIRKLKKLYCKKVVDGVEFSELLDIADLI